MPSLSMSLFSTLAVILLGAATPGCVSDFSPEPLKGPQNIAKGPDGGMPAGDAGRSLQDAAALGSPPLTRTDGGTDVMGTPEDGETPVSSAAPCDLSGRWIATERVQTSAFGAQQVTQTWFYFELTQLNDELTIAQSLMCGGAINQAPGEAFQISVDDHNAWPAYQTYINYNGRKGSSRDNGTGCDVSFEPDTLVRGMTPAYYRDASHPLPTLDQEESGSSPGWADWDQDGKPGISQVVTGGLSNTLYSAVRFFTLSLGGSIGRSVETFKLDDFDWRQERVVLGSREPDPAGLLVLPAERNPGAGLNFYEFARLGADQATGSDDEICGAIRMLAPTLNPDANRR